MITVILGSKVLSCRLAVIPVKYIQYIIILSDTFLDRPSCKEIIHCLAQFIH